VREGWKNIVSCLVRLHRHDLLPTLFELEDIFKFKKAAAVENKPANNGSPLLGLMSSFWPFGGGSGASSAQNPEVRSYCFRETGQFLHPKTRATLLEMNLIFFNCEYIADAIRARETI
jgi:hypothetical protein